MGVPRSRLVHRVEQVASPSQGPGARIRTFGSWSTTHITESRRARILWASKNSMKRPASLLRRRMSLPRFAPTIAVAVSLRVIEQAMPIASRSVPNNIVRENTGRPEGQSCANGKGRKRDHLSARNPRAYDYESSAEGSGCCLPCRTVPRTPFVSYADPARSPDWISLVILSFPAWI